jgi:hypothetical protein
LLAIVMVKIGDQHTSQLTISPPSAARRAPAKRGPLSLNTVLNPHRRSMARLVISSPAGRVGRLTRERDALLVMA